MFTGLVAGVWKWNKSLTKKINFLGNGNHDIESNGIPFYANLIF